MSKSRFESKMFAPARYPGTAGFYGVWDNREKCWAATDNGCPYPIPIDRPASTAKSIAAMLNDRELAGTMITPWDLDINLFDPTGGLRQIPCSRPL